MFTTDVHVALSLLLWLVVCAYGIQRIDVFGYLYVCVCEIHLSRLCRDGRKRGRGGWIFVFRFFFCFSGELICLLDALWVAGVCAELDIFSNIHGCCAGARYAGVILLEAWRKLFWEHHGR